MFDSLHRVMWVWYDAPCSRRHPGAPASRRRMAEARQAPQRTGSAAVGTGYRRLGAGRVVHRSFREMARRNGTDLGRHRIGMPRCCDGIGEVPRNFPVFGAGAQAEIANGETRGLRCDRCWDAQALCPNHVERAGRRRCTPSILQARSGMRSRRPARRSIRRSAFQSRDWPCTGLSAPAGRLLDCAAFAVMQCVRHGARSRRAERDRACNTKRSRTSTVDFLDQAIEQGACAARPTSMALPNAGASVWHFRRKEPTADDRSPRHQRR